MVFTMLESRSSAAATLDYNYRKVADGSATIVAHYRLPNLSRSGVYDTFARLEYTDYPVKEVGFHMAVNPGPDDTCTEDQIIKAIYKTMYKLGYKSQPFLVFRHNDIDRTHYHVVSSRISAITGRKINNHNEKRRLTDYTRSIGPEFNFTVPDGAAEKAANKYVKRDTLVPGRFVPGKGVYPQLRGIYAHALQYGFSDFSDLAAVLELKGVRATLRGPPDAPKVVLRGLDADGNPVTAPVSESQAKRDWYKGYEGMKYVHSHVNYSRFNELKYRIGLAFDESRTAVGLMQYLKRLGIEPVVVNDAAGHIRTVKFISHKDMAVIDLRALPLPLQNKILKASVQVQAAQHISFSAIARILYPVGQPHGASWSGKVAPTKEQLQDKWRDSQAGRMDADFTEDVGGPKLK